MLLIKNIKTLKNYIKKIRQQNKTIGFVPTMGYLHQGHLSLVKKAAKECDIVAVSIFVNPAQFSPNEDLSKYPRDLTRDLGLLKKEKTDIVFFPNAKMMYPAGFKTYLKVEELSRVLCGISRPNHFKGVTTVVAKLFNLIQPDIAYFGQKDAQQSIIIKRMAEDLNMDVKIKASPTIREKDGLAMSSRNIYLNKGERKNAVILYKSLKEAKRLICNGLKDSNKIIEIMRQMINSVKGAKIDYVSIVDTNELKPLKIIKGAALIAMAVYFGKTRLIDNIVVKNSTD